MPAVEEDHEMGTAEESDKLLSPPSKATFDFAINLDFCQGPSSTFSNLVMLANNYLNQQNSVEGRRISSSSHQTTDENEAGETSESSMDRDEKERSPIISAKASKHDISHPCTICKMEAATVSHFGVDVCTGCRAFFRRSVSQQKTYRCLNSKLCGKANLVPNRRVCKFCRFQRCIDAGMLKSKEQLYNQKLDNPSHKISTSSHSSSSTVISRRSSEAIASLLTFPAASSSSTDSVMDHFLHLRRKITYDRLQTYYGKNKLDEDIFVDCNHTVGLGLRESQLIVEILGRSPVFDGIPAADQRILFGDYSCVWTIHEQILSTVRNGGHLTRKMYFADGTNLRLTDDLAFKYWEPLFATIKDKRPVIIEMVGRFLLNLATYTTLEISKFMVNASMNEEELAAFTALLFLRPEILSAVSPESRVILSQRRHQLLNNLSSYLISTGQKIDERMSKIILLISEMQTAIRMLKHAINIIRVTTTEDSILPKSYIELFEEGARDISSLLNAAQQLPVNFK